MSFNFLKKNIKQLPKKLLLLTTILTNILSVYLLSIENKTNPSNKRNLQFTSKSIYYIKPYPKNNITGTGDIMEDSAYKTLCKILSCDSGCCVGNIESINCGDKNLCDVYIDYVTARVVVPAVIVPIFVVLFVTLMILVFMKRNKYSFLKSFFLAALCLFVITIPCILYYARKRAKDSEIDNLIQKQKEEEDKAKSESVDKNKVNLNGANLERNEILLINKLDEKKASSKLSSKKNDKSLNEYKKIINEFDENQEQEKEEEFKLQEEIPIIEDNQNINNNKSLESEVMDIGGYALTDPLQNKKKSENFNTEQDKLIEEEEKKKEDNEASPAAEENTENQQNQKEENKEEQKEEIKENPAEENAEPKLEEESEKIKDAEREKMSESLQKIKSLPLLKTPEDAAKRSALFEKFDRNGNSYLSLGEVNKGIRDVLDFNEKILNTGVIKKAFRVAKNSGPKRSEISDDYIEKNEFRTFLVYLRQYSEYIEMFDLIDIQDDKKISFEEFKDAIPAMEKWGIEIDNPEAAFDSIDTNKGGQILFEEFVKWAIAKNLDLENDDDFNDEELAKLA